MELWELLEQSSMGSSEPGPADGAHPQLAQEEESELLERWAQPSE